MQTSWFDSGYIFGVSLRVLLKEFRCVGAALAFEVVGSSVVAQLQILLVSHRDSPVAVH